MKFGCFYFSHVGYYGFSMCAFGGPRSQSLMFLSYILQTGLARFLHCCVSMLLTSIVIFWLLCHPSLFQTDALFPVSMVVLGG